MQAQRVRGPVPASASLPPGGRAPSAYPRLRRDLPLPRWALQPMTDRPIRSQANCADRWYVRRDHPGARDDVDYDLIPGLLPPRLLMLRHPRVRPPRSELPPTRAVYARHAAVLRRRPAASDGYRRHCAPCVVLDDRPVHAGGRFFAVSHPCHRGYLRHADVPVRLARCDVNVPDALRAAGHCSCLPMLPPPVPDCQAPAPWPALPPRASVGPPRRRV